MHINIIRKTMSLGGRLFWGKKEDVTAKSAENTKF